MSDYLKKYSKSEIRDDLFNLYYSSLYNLSNLGKDFNIDDIASTLALYYYAYDNGYLSYQHHFEYSGKEADFYLLPPTDLGFVISTGYGVCRNISFGLRDFLTINNIKSYIATVDSKEYNASPKELAILVNILPKLFGNHVINYIGSNHSFFLYDPTDNIFPEIVGYSLMKEPNSNKEYPVWIVNDINNGIIMPTIRKQQSNKKLDNIKQSFKQSLDLFNKNKDIFEKYYQENKEIYWEMNYKLSKVKEKKLY